MRIGAISNEMTADSSQLEETIDRTYRLVEEWCNAALGEPQPRKRQIEWKKYGF